MLYTCYTLHDRWLGGIGRVVPIVDKPDRYYTSISVTFDKPNRNYTSISVRPINEIVTIQAFPCTPPYPCIECPWPRQPSIATIRTVFIVRPKSKRLFRVTRLFLKRCQRHYRFGDFFHFNFKPKGRNVKKKRKKKICPASSYLIVFQLVTRNIPIIVCLITLMSNLLWVNI